MGSLGHGSAATNLPFFVYNATSVASAVLAQRTIQLPTTLGRRVLRVRGVASRSLAAPGNHV